MKTTRFLFALILLSATITGAIAQKTSRKEKAEADSTVHFAIRHAIGAAWAYAGENGLKMRRMPLPESWPYLAVDGRVMKNRPVALQQPKALISYDGNGYLDATTKEREILVGHVMVPLGHTGSQASQTIAGRLIPAGSRKLFVPRNGSVAERTKGSITYDTDSLTFNFEQGKYYTIHSSIDKENRIEFSIGETSTADYLAFMEAHPGYLDGTWFRENKTIQGKFPIRMTFSQSTMTFEGGVPSRRNIVAQGRFIYNENTIILFPETTTVKGKETKTFGGEAHIWYYTLIDGELFLDDNKAPISGGWGANGAYEKSL